ncbi:type I toxin-antitoxin system Fst family toxin [Salinicoccus sp. YB14-2]|nr:type I toxin-antitoxin system Fst family toxin [Salinicoccus sp. YB14-2]
MFMGVFELIIAPIVVGAIITLFAFWLKSREK